MFIALLLFAVSFVSILAVVGLATSFFKRKQTQQIRSMLRKAEEAPVVQKEAQFLKPINSDTLAKFLQRFEFISHLNLIIEQSGGQYTASKLILISCVACVIGYVFGLKIKIFAPQFGAWGLAGVAGVLPFLIVLRKRAKNFANFEQQLPEALDFISRCMRAGHGFTIALEMLVDDAPDPLGSAFRRVANDLQLGSSLEVSLSKLVRLVPVLDVRFFASSVLLQQETGGNLAEILNKLAMLIRERFRLKGQVKAVSAHGRITGLVLVLMPIAVTFFMMMISPSYLTDLAADKIGRIMIYGALGGQVVGYFVIKKITNIKV